LRPLTEPEVDLFIERHIRAAGGKKNLFDAEAIAIIFSPQPRHSPTHSKSRASSHARGHVHEPENHRCTVRATGRRRDGGTMSSAPPTDAAQVVLPPLSGAEALLLVRILDRTTATLWRVHGDSMMELPRTASKERLRDEPAKSTRRRAPSETAALVPDESEISEQPQLAILATLKHAAASAICALRARAAPGAP
jgi:hypothetical protein